MSSSPAFATKPAEELWASLSPSMQQAGNGTSLLKSFAKKIAETNPKK